LTKKKKKFLLALHGGYCGACDIDGVMIKFGSLGVLLLLPKIPLLLFVDNKSITPYNSLCCKETKGA
jgi:hypothetical protein